MTISKEAGTAEVHSAETAIRIRGLRKTHDGGVAINGVDLEVRRGEIFGLLGPEGAGKTTMLETIGGREKPDAGQIEVAGRVAVRPRDAALFGPLTLHETLATFADLHDGDYSPTRIRELLEKTSLTHKTGSTVEALYGDERLRFTLALALAGGAEIILLDEPTAGLEQPARREAWETIREMRDAGVAVVVATGDMEEALESCDRVALMDRGRVVARSAPSPSA